MVKAVAQGQGGWAPPALGWEWQGPHFGEGAAAELQTESQTSQAGEEI